MNKFRPLYIVVAVFVILSLTGCEILRTNEGAAGDITEFTPPEAAEEAPAEQDGAVLRLQPAVQQLNVGQITTVELLIENVTNLFGVEIQLQFAPSVLQVQDADPNSENVQITIGNFLAPDLLVTNEVNNTAGLVSLIFTQTSETPPATGSGVLASFQIEAVGSSDSTFMFSTVKLSNSEGQEIPAIPQITQVAVGQDGQVTPTVDQLTATPVVTITATPSLTPATTATITPTVVVTTTLVPTPTPIPEATPTFTPIPPPPTSVPPPMGKPSPPLAKMPKGATVGFCYRVQKGETLSDIAKHFRVTVDLLQTVNDLYPQGYIYPQKALFIPTRPGNGPNFYIVREGDTLDTIAEACNLPVNFLAWLNDLRLQNGGVVPRLALEIPLPPFPPPSRYAYPPSGPFGPPSVYPPAGFGGPPGGGNKPPCAPHCNSQW